MLSGLLRGACHRARIRATRWLAMTMISSRRFVAWIITVYYDDSALIPILAVSLVNVFGSRQAPQLWLFARAEDHYGSFKSTILLSTPYQHHSRLAWIG